MAKKYISRLELDELFETAKKSWQYHSEMESYGFVRYRIKTMLEHLSYREKMKDINYIILDFSTEREDDDRYDFHPGKDPMNEGWETLFCAKLQDEDMNAYFEELLEKYFIINKMSDNEWKVTLKR